MIFGGQQGVIAHVDFSHTHEVGKYGVDVAAFARLVDASLGSTDVVGFTLRNCAARWHRGPLSVGITRRYALGAAA